MYLMYSDGSTLEEVGARFHLSRQRVQQVFQEAGLPTRSLAETQELRHARIVRERSAEIRDAFSATRDIAAVAEQLGLSKAVVREIVERHFPPSARRPRKQRPRQPLYAPDELIPLLHEAAAAVPGRLTAASYERYAEGRSLADGRPWPSPQTVAKRFGTWRSALSQVGIDQ